MRWNVALAMGLPLTLTALLATAAEPPIVDGLALPPPKLAETEAARSKLEETLRAADLATRDLDSALGKAPIPAPPKPPEPAEAKAAGLDLADPSAARAEAVGRLKELEKEPPAAVKEAREAIEARLKLLDEWDRATAMLRESEQPRITPDREVADLTRDLARARATLARAGKEPDALLTQPFRVAKAEVSDGALREMKGAIDVACEAARELKATIERKEPSRLDNLRTFRESIHKRRDGRGASLKRAVDELAAATTVESRALARDRLINERLEEKVVGQLHEAIEAAIALETRREPAFELRQQLQATELELADKAVEQMQARYRELAERQQGDLARKAAVEQDRSVRSTDPLERYRARRAAEMLDLEALLLRDERTLAARPTISEEDQKALADRAQEDFDHLKALVEGGRSNALVATRLNNSYRRTASERERIVRHDLARASALLSLHENALTDIELDQLNDARDDRAPLDALLESLPPSRRPAAQALASEFDARRRSLLDDRHQAVQHLAMQAEAAQRQVNRRLRILDEQHAFIRTHIFWVRDTTPLGSDTFRQAGNESRTLLHSGLKIAREAGDTHRWGRNSWEFGLACLGIIVLPWPLSMTRRALRPQQAP